MLCGCSWAGDKVGGIGHRLDLLVWEGFSHLGLYIRINTIEKKAYLSEMAPVNYREREANNNNNHNNGNNKLMWKLLKAWHV